MPNEQEGQAPEEQGEGQKQEPSKDEGNDKLMSTLNEVSESIKDLGGRVDDLSGRVDSMGQPTNEPEDNKTEETEETEEKWQPATWDEVPKKVREVSEQTAREVLEAKEAEDAEKTKQDEELVNAINDEFDQKEKELEKEGIIVPVKNQDDPNDPGRVMRKKIYARAHSLDTPDIARVGKELKELEEQGFDYDVDTRKFIKAAKPNPGKTAPIGSSSNRSGQPTSGLNYKDLHRARDLDEVQKRFESS